MVSADDVPAESNALPNEIQRQEPQLELGPIPKDQQSIPSSKENTQYMTGWRLWVLTAGLWVALFLSTIETTIVSTSLVSITNALDGFLIRDWIVTAYLLTFTGFLTIYAKMSDVLGRKTMLVVGIALFTISSLLCGISNNIVELIIFRAFQGIGASGIYSMITVIAPTLVPAEKFGKYMGIIATIYIIASVLGPVLGGVINRNKDGSTWRWVFLLNVPGGVFALAIIIWCLPASDATANLSLGDRFKAKFAKTSLKRIDYLGMVLLLAFSVLLVFALEMGGTRYSWSSSIVIATLVVSAVSGIGFFAWEVLIDRESSVQEPVFPPNILKERLASALLLTALFVGFPFVSIVVNIPQRAQAVNGFSALNSGIALLPLILTSPLATALSGLLTGKPKVPPVYLVITGSVLQLIGMGLMCSLSTSTTDMQKSQYGFEVLMGLGFGLGLTTVITFARVVVSEKNLPVMMGAVTQIRVLGGTVSLAICSAILNNHLNSKLRDILTTEQIKEISESLSAISDFTPDEQRAIRLAFSEGYNLQNAFMTVMTALGLVTSLFLMERRPRIIV